MAELRPVRFDERTSSADRYYLSGDIVEENGSLWRVNSVKRHRGSIMEAVLERIDSPTAEDRKQAKTWGYNRTTQVMGWQPLQRDEPEVLEPAEADTDDR